jgi:YfiH family protein
MRDNNTIIYSEILSSFPEITHGISTKIGGYDSPPFYNNMSYKVGDEEQNVKANRDKFFGSLGIDQKLLAIPQQVHSDKIVIADKPGFYPETDGLITALPDLYLIISTADCYSAMIYDSVKKIIAAVHSGWRGTQKKIVTKAVEMMKKEFACLTEDLNVFAGPGISCDNFEVGKEVADMFDEKFISKVNGKYFADLKAHIKDQLETLGIYRMEIYPNCTFEEKDYLHSYRRDRDKSGRMYSVIGRRG